MFTTRCWGVAAVLLHALLLQNCQSTSLRATEEEELSASPSSASAVREHTPSEPMAVQPLALPSASLAAHVSPSSLSTTLASEEVLSTALSSSSLGSVARHALATVGNSLKDSKPPAQQRSTTLASEDDLANNELRAGEIWGPGDTPRDVLDILLAMASSQPDKAIQFLDVLLVAAQDSNCRQQALEAFGKVAKAPSDMFSACLPSLRAVAKAGDRDVRLLALKTLGEVEWKHYFGEVGPAPDLPGNMGAILDSRCPFWPGKRVRDTHLLVLIPATVNGEPFTLDLLGELIQRPKNGGKKIKYRYYNGTVKAQIGTTSPKASYWLLMTRNVLPKSRSKTYANQKKLVAGHAMRTNMPYEPPKALEAATAILVHHVRNGERLYSNNPCTHTRCQEWILHQSNEYFSIVGGFESSGLDVGYRIFYGSSSDVGVAGCRKFF